MKPQDRRELHKLAQKWLKRAAVLAPKGDAEPVDILREKARELRQCAADLEEHANKPVDEDTIPAPTGRG